MRVLCELCLNNDKAFFEIYDDAVLLTPYAVIPRYPAELRLIERDAADAVERAEKVMAFAVARISLEDSL